MSNNRRYDSRGGGYGDADNMQRDSNFADILNRTRQNINRISQKYGAAESTNMSMSGGDRRQQQHDYFRDNASKR
jgi:hypothetical protein